MLKGYRSFSRGFLTIDVAIAIAIVAVITVFVLLHGARLWNSIHGSHVSQDVLSVKNQILIRFSAFPDFGELNTELAMKTGLFPDHWIYDNKIMDPWGGEVTVEGLGHQAVISLSEVPSDACQSMVSSLGVNFNDIQVNAVSVMDAHHRLDMHIIVTQCDAQEKNSVSLSFDKV